ncbi:MAG: ECF transporter S component [Firmicutes bacterium]|nr:ECF transporter S component [Bacillota bacterium]
MELTKKRFGVKEISTLGMLTAVVVVLQFLGSFIKFGTFSVSLVLVPIVIGAALYGPYAGAWLGFVFSVVVLISGDSAAFLTINVPATIATCIIKGTFAGLAAGFVYNAIARFSFKASKYVATFAAAIVCPIVNTGIFLIGCRLFFYDTVAMWGESLGFANAAAYMFIGLAGGNFLFEVLFNIVISPAIIRIINIRELIKK